MTDFETKSGVENALKKGFSGANELELIAGIRARTRGRKSKVRMGIGDDCALLSLKKGEELAVTTDLSIEDVHFRRNWHTPEAVGHRCLARGLSDLAAMGARPVAAFLSIALPKELTAAINGECSWLERFLDGMLLLADRSGVPLAGGDTAQAASVAADIVLVGSVKRGAALLRSGARAGDAIYVTGALGGAAAELLAVERSPATFFRMTAASEVHPHLFPEPRIEVGRKLVRKGLASSAIDLSDGLSIDLRHLCEESELVAEIEAASVPVHLMARLAEAAEWAPSALDLALHGGEDYELLFTVPAKIKVPAKIGGVAVRRIGRMQKPGKGKPMVEIRSATGRRPLEARGWEHFRGN